MGIRIYVEQVKGTQHDFHIASKPDHTTGERFIEIGGALSAHLEGVIGTIHAILRKGDARVTRVTIVNDSLSAAVNVPCGYLVQKRRLRVHVHRSAGPDLGNEAFHFSLECKGPLIFLRILRQLTSPVLLQQLVFQAHPELVGDELSEIERLRKENTELSGVLAEIGADIYGDVDPSDDGNES